MSEGPTNAGGRLRGLRVGILVAPGFEEEEVTRPRRALDDAGAKTSLLASVPSRVRAWHGKDWGAEFSVEKLLEEAQPNELDALVLPGGVMSSDHLRADPHARALTKDAMEHNKPVAAICHGPWLLVDTDSARGRRLTSHPRIASDMKNAGAAWFDAGVVVDGNLVTSRRPDDLTEFVAQMLEIFGKAAEKRSAVSP